MQFYEKKNIYLSLNSLSLSMRIKILSFKSVVGVVDLNVFFGVVYIGSSLTFHRLVI